MDPAIDTQLKLIAIVFQEPLFSYVKQQQNFIADTWGCCKALRTPPHITLIPPIPLKMEEIDILESLLIKIANKNYQFVLEVNKYAAFKPRVVYLNTTLPKELNRLYSNLRNTIEKEIPHVLYRYGEFSTNFPFTTMQIKIILHISSVLSAYLVQCMRNLSERTIFRSFHQ